jgi:N-acetylglutamate synthase-like GNAT family acetyltransferase
MKTRKARSTDVPQIHKLIEHYASRGTLLPRSEDDIIEHLGGFLVAVDRGIITGCVSVESYGIALAEIRSLAVQPYARGRGIGTKLMSAALDLAEERQIGRVLALTSSPEFFLRQGFELSNRFAIKEKIERDCSHCAKSASCRLAAVVMNVSASHLAFRILPAMSDVVQAE